MSELEKRLRNLGWFLLASGVLLIAAAFHSGYVLGVHFDETGTSGFMTSALVVSIVFGVAQVVTGLLTLLSARKKASTQA